MKSIKLVKNDSNLSTILVGSYYVRAFKISWGLYVQIFKNGKKTDTKVEDLAYLELGFKKEWSLEQARERCKRLNKEKSLSNARVREAAARVAQLTSLNEILFPQDVVKAFSKRLEDENEGSENHLKKMNSHFLKVQKLCSDLELLPSDYYDNKKLIYKWFAKNKVSIDYTQKLISLLNRWGHFVSRRDGKFFESVPPARGLSRELINNSHEGKTGVRTESEPISPLLLEKRKEKLSEANYNYLFATIWFGLRPHEMSSALKSKTKLNDDGTEFLIVYQSKLVTIEKSKRFKAIPILFPEQEVALEILKSGNVKAPIYKRMNQVFGQGYGLYGGRKGFTDLMLGKGYKIEDISLWLGHTSIETTWKHYKNKNVLNLPTPKRNV